MKLLFQTKSRLDIDKAKLLLESNGIPVFIGNENSSRFLGPLGPAASLGFWVVIDDQTDDAIALLNNENHVVSNPVDVDAYYQQLEKTRSTGMTNIANKIMLVIVVVLISGFAIFVYNKL